MRAWLGSVLGAAVLGGCTPVDWEVPDDAEPSPGCGGEDPVGTVAHETIEIEGSERRYTVRFPGSYRPQFPFPLVFAFHGAGSNGTQFRELIGLEEAARARAVFVYPTAEEDQDGVTRWDGAPDGPDFALVHAIERELSEAYCIDQARVFAVGFSNGAAFGNELACAGEVDALAAVSGGGPNPPDCAGPLPAVVVHGRVDPVVPFAYGEHSRDAWLAQNGCANASEPTSPEPCRAYEGCDAPVHWCEHDDPVQIAHGWSAWTDDAVWNLLGAI